jgi:hypothetical protein
MLSTDLIWENYLMSWAMIKKLTVEEAAADPECKSAFEIWQQPTPVVLSEAKEPTVEPAILSEAEEPPKKRTYKRKPKVVLSVAEETTVEQEPTVEPTVEEVVAEPEPTVEVAPVVAVKIPKPRVTRKVLRL